MVAEFWGKFASLLLLLKLAKFGHMLQFVSWKLLGELTNLEFAIIPAGGILNKLLSMAATKLGMIEFRQQTQRAADNDTGRDLTNYLVGCIEESVSYLVCGVVRRAKAWMETRRQAKDLDPSEYEPAWAKLKLEAFDHAKSSLQKAIKVALDCKIPEDVLSLRQGLE